jgi:hypothetical protein
MKVYCTVVFQSCEVRESNFSDCSTFGAYENNSEFVISSIFSTMIGSSHAMRIATAFFVSGGCSFPVSRFISKATLEGNLVVMRTLPRYKYIYNTVFNIQSLTP